MDKNKRKNVILYMKQNTFPYLKQGRDDRTVSRKKYEQIVGLSMRYAEKAIKKREALVG